MIDLDIHLPLSSLEVRLATRLVGPVTVLMGPSGAGKTSVLEAIAGLRPRVRGRIAVGDQVLLDTTKGLRLAPERRRVGYVPQDAGLFPHLTAIENVRFGARGDGRRVGAAIETLEIEPVLGRPPSSLSGGERQRVALARALATEPELLLLDEPLAALDPGLKERVLPYLLRIRDDWGVPTLYVTHNVGEALALAQEVVLIDGGRLTAQGPPLDLLAVPALAREAEAGIENLFRGRILAHDAAAGVTRVQVASGHVVSVTLTEARRLGDSITLAVRAEDVLVATELPQHVSARNVFEASIVGVTRSGPDVLVRCSLGATTPPWLVRLTPAAVSDLGLASGSAVWLAVKSHSVRIL